MWNTRSELNWILMMVIVTGAFAQSRPALGGGLATPTTAGVAVEVHSDIAGPFASPLLVEVSTAGGIPVLRTVTDSAGKATLNGLAPGNYSITVSGQGIHSETAFADITDSEFTRRVTMMVSRDAAPARSPATSSTVSAAELHLSGKAKKTYERGLKFALKHDWDHAIAEFTRLTEVAPIFSNAFTSLGMAYYESRQFEKAEQSLQHAIELSSTNAMALRALARLQIAENNFAEAEKELLHATQYDPANPEGQLLLAFTQLKERKFPESVRTAARVSDSSPERSSAAHCIAAQSYDQQGDRTHAAAEYELCRKIDPTSPNVKLAESRLAALRGNSH